MSTRGSQSRQTFASEEPMVIGTKTGEVSGAYSCSHQSGIVAWWLEHWTPDRKAWDRCSMPPNTLRVHTEYVLVKSVGPKVLWAVSRVQEAGEYFLPLQSHGKIVEVEIGGVAIYRPFGEFR
ncbi:uncharacterized protein TNCV_3324611 [Trichonephila clavipes]|nr:uncharacterized protein TNCV_3324611 [Trichonephila clavipes]